MYNKANKRKEDEKGKSEVIGGRSRMKKKHKKERE